MHLQHACPPVRGVLLPTNTWCAAAHSAASPTAGCVLQGAHHLDLMFSHPLDPQSVMDARETELKHITRWIKHASHRHPEQAERYRWWQQRQEKQEPQQRRMQDKVQDTDVMQDGSTGGSSIGKASTEEQQPQQHASWWRFWHSWQQQQQSGLRGSAKLMAAA